MALSSLNLYNNINKFDFKKYYEIENILKNQLCMIPRLNYNVFSTLQLNLYDRDIVRKYDINTYKLDLLPKKNRNKFLNNFIKSNFYKFQISKKIVILKNIISNTKNDINQNQLYIFNRIIGEYYYKSANYNKAIDYFKISQDICFELIKNHLIMEHQIKSNHIHDYYLIYPNSKQLNQLSYNIGLIDIQQNHDLNKALQPLLYSSGKKHIKSTQLCIVLLLKYYYIFNRDNIEVLLLHINKQLYILLTNDYESNHEEHYIIGLLYYMLNESPYLSLAVKHLQISSAENSSANMLLGLIYYTRGCNYNIFKSMSYFQNVKKLGYRSIMSIKCCKIMLQNDIKNQKRFNFIINSILTNKSFTKTSFKTNYTFIKYIIKGNIDSLYLLIYGKLT